MASLARPLIALLLLMVLGCGDSPAPTVNGEVREKVEIWDQQFLLEIAADDETRFQGLSNRESIEDNGGMIFLFPTPMLLEFVMRDCPIDIDIIFLDASGRVTASHAMKAEAPRMPGESDFIYNNRLKKYSSRFDAQFVIELDGGTIEANGGIPNGTKIDLDIERLKTLAR